MGPLFDFKKIKCIKKNLGNNNHKPKILKITAKKNCKFPSTSNLSTWKKLAIKLIFEI